MAIPIAQSKWPWLYQRDLDLVQGLPDALDLELDYSFTSLNSRISTFLRFIRITIKIAPAC